MIVGGDSHIEKKFPSEEELMQVISDYDVFRHYIGQFQIGDVISSPLREDKSPSFSIYKTKKPGNPLFFKDFGNGEFGGIIRFVEKVFGLNHREAIDKVILDFRQEDNYLVSNTSVIKSSKEPRSYDKVEALNNAVKMVKYKSRDWNKLDKHYWYDRFGISKALLIKYNVIPIKYIFVNDMIIPADKVAYSFIEYKDGFKRCKIYQPLSEKIKWLSGFTEGTLSGFSQLPIKGDLLFIASSLKDGLVLKSLGYDFIAPQTEGYTFKENVLDGLRKRFSNIVTFFDDDNAGRIASERVKDKYGIPYILTNSNEKDVAEFREVHGAEATKELITERLWDIL